MNPKAFPACGWNLPNYKLLSHPKHADSILLGTPANEIRASANGGFDLSLIQMLDGVANMVLESICQECARNRGVDR